MDRPSNEPDNSPVTQDDQPDTGPVDAKQKDGTSDRERNLPQGSEPETRGTSGGR